MSPLSAFEQVQTQGSLYQTAWDGREVSIWHQCLQLSLHLSLGKSSLQSIPPTPCLLPCTKKTQNCPKNCPSGSYPKFQSWRGVAGHPHDTEAHHQLTLPMLATSSPQMPWICMFEISSASSCPITLQLTPTFDKDGFCIFQVEECTKSLKPSSLLNSPFSTKKIAMEILTEEIQKCGRHMCHA